MYRYVGVCVYFFILFTFLFFSHFLMNKCLHILGLKWSLFLQIVFGIILHDLFIFYISLCSAS